MTSYTSMAQLYILKEYYEVALHNFYTYCNNNLIKQILGWGQF